MLTFNRFMFLVVTYACCVRLLMPAAAVFSTTDKAPETILSLLEQLKKIDNDESSREKKLIINKLLLVLPDSVIKHKTVSIPHAESILSTIKENLDLCATKVEPQSQEELEFYQIKYIFTAAKKEIKLFKNQQKKILERQKQEYVRKILRWSSATVVGFSLVASFFISSISRRPEERFEGSTQKRSEDSTKPYLNLISRAHPSEVLQPRTLHQGLPSTQKDLLVEHLNKENQNGDYSIRIVKTPAKQKTLHTDKVAGSLDEDDDTNEDGDNGVEGTDKEIPAAQVEGNTIVISENLVNTIDFFKHWSSFQHDACSENPGIYPLPRRVTNRTTLEALAACLTYLPELTLAPKMLSSAKISAFENFNTHLPKMTKDQLIEVIKTLDELTFSQPLPALIHHYLTLVGEKYATDFQNHFNNLEEIQKMIRIQYFYRFNKKIDEVPLTTRVEDFLDYDALKLSSSTSFITSGEKANLGFNEEKKVVTLNTMALDELELDGIERFFQDETYTTLHLSGFFKNIKSTTLHKGESLLNLIKILTIKIPLTASHAFIDVPQLPNLEKLEIWLFKETGEEKFFENLFKHFPTLQELALYFHYSGCTITLDAFKSLAHLKKLTLYEITPNFPIQFWKHLPELTEITVYLKADDTYIPLLFNREDIPASLRRVSCTIKKTPENFSKITQHDFQQMHHPDYQAEWQRKLRALLPPHVVTCDVSITNY